MTTTSSDLHWFKGIGSERYAFLDEAKTVKLTELSTHGGQVAPLYVLEQFLERGSAKVQWSATFSTLEAGLDAVVVS